MAVFTYDSGALGTGITLSPSSCIATTSSGAWAIARTTVALAAGKHYCEFQVLVGGGNGIILGITNAAHSLNTHLGNATGSMGWQIQGSVYGPGTTGMTGLTYAAGDILCLAIDVPNKRAWIRKNDGAWAGGGDPAAGTSPATWAFTGDVYFAPSIINNTNSVLVNSGLGQTTYSAPSGFSTVGDALTTPPVVRSTAVGTEAWLESAPPLIRSTAVGTEVWLEPQPPATRITAVGTEIWFDIAPPVMSTQVIYIG
jgi:hypothetical protein